MTMETPTEEQVLTAASAIVDAFRATDGPRYFSLFAEDATFVFHTEAARLNDRAAYERVWAEWVDGGWHVVSCDSSEARVQTFPGGAVFSHSVATAVETGDGPDSYRERESIIFRSDTEGLVAVHEHLSPTP